MQLSINNVSKNYANVTAIKALSFSVAQGEIFALLGPNGAGKSSIIRMITGFTKPDYGSITLSMDGEEFDAIPSHTLGYLPEDRGLYPEKSILKNILYFAQLNGMEKGAALVQADYWLTRFELQDRKNEQLKSLSKGNQQKVQLITAVIHRPKWVILDEPFSGLDPVNQEKVVEFLSELTAKGMTVILSAHQMAMVEKLADRILLMNKGEAVFYGSLDDFQKQEHAHLQMRIKFNKQVSAELTEQVLSEIEHKWLDELSLKATLNDKITMNVLLTKLASLGEINSVTSEKRDLHQLYLDAIGNQRSAANEE